MNELAGRRALVTGAGINIGRGIAVELARRGAAVAVHHPPGEEGAADTTAEIKACGGSAFPVEGDLTTCAECAQVVDAAADALGGLDILINNAGITRNAEFVSTDEACFDEIFDLNIKGAFFSTQRAVERHLSHGSAIINISSIHGKGGHRSNLAYSASKGALDTFTRGLGFSLAERGIRVNAVAPGTVEIPRYFDNPAYTRQMGESWVPMGRVGQPADIAHAVAYLASPTADFITGQILYVDGGAAVAP